MYPDTPLLVAEVAYYHAIEVIEILEYGIGYYLYSSGGRKSATPRSLHDFRFGSSSTSARRQINCVK
jgi:hypothetical protein